MNFIIKVQTELPVEPRKPEIVLILKEKSSSVKHMEPIVIGSIMVVLQTTFSDVFFIFCVAVISAKVTAAHDPLSFS